MTIDTIIQVNGNSGFGLHSSAPPPGVPLSVVERVSSCSFPLNTTGATPRETTPLSAVHLNPATAAHLVRFYDLLPIANKPMFQGTSVEQATQINHWMCGEGLTQIQNIKTLQLANQNLTALPLEIGYFTGLQILDLSSNLLTSLPSEIGNLTNLLVLNLSDNQLTVLTPQIQYLTKLRQLHLIYNELTLLPSEIGKLTALQILNLSDNLLRAIPAAINALLNISVLNLENNPLPKCQLLLSDAVTHFSRGSMDPSTALSKEIIISPYNIPQHLGYPNIDPPLVARVAHNDANIFGPYINTLLHHMGADPKITDINFPEIDPIALCAEVHEGIQQIRQTQGEMTSVAAALLKGATPSSLIGQIHTTATQIMLHAQGLALPGGLDIERVFYDEKAPLTLSSDYRRSIAEFALVAAAHTMKKPILGTCRGAQLINVFFGGTLKNVTGQFGWQKIDFTNSSKKELLTTVMQANAMLSFAFHDQACDQIAPGFEVVAHCGNIPKIIMSEDGLIMGIQVHPEKPDGAKYSSAIRIYEVFFQQMMRKKIPDEGKTN